MAGKPRVIGNGYAAENHPVAWLISMHVITLADTNVRAALKAVAHEALVGGAQILGGGQFDVRRFALDHRDLDARPFGHRRIVGKMHEPCSSSAAVGLAYRAIAKALRRLSRPETFPIHR